MQLSSWGPKVDHKSDGRQALLSNVNYKSLRKEKHLAMKSLLFEALTAEHLINFWLVWQFHLSGLGSVDWVSECRLILINRSMVVTGSLGKCDHIFPNGWFIKKVNERRKQVCSALGKSDLYDPTTRIKREPMSLKKITLTPHVESDWHGFSFLLQHMLPVGLWLSYLSILHFFNGKMEVIVSVHYSCET